MRLTKNFTQREFKTKKDVSLIANELQVLRDFLGQRLRVLNYDHSNKSVDIKSMDIDNEDLYLILASLIQSKDLKEGKIGLYPKFVRYEINK